MEYTGREIRLFSEQIFLFFSSVNCNVKTILMAQQLL